MHPDAQVVMRGFQAFDEGDIGAMKELFAEDATWHTGGRNKWSGDYTGADAILRFFGEISSEAQIDNQPHAILADDEHVVVLVNSTSTRGEASVSSGNVFVFHVDDGKVTEVWNIADNPYAIDEFWGS